MTLESILDIIGEVQEREGLRMGNEMYRALNSPLEENQLREALWRIIAALKQRNIRYPKIFLRRAKEIEEGRWRPKVGVATIRSCVAPRPEDSKVGFSAAFLERHPELRKRA